MSRPAQGPTQPPTKRVQVALSLVVKRAGHEADHSPPCNDEVKECVEQYPTPPIRRHSVVLNYEHGQLYLYLTSVVVNTFFQFCPYAGENK